MKTGWNKVIVTQARDLPKYSWALAYFQKHADGKWDGDTYIMNLHELRIRDLALFNLGDIKNKNVLELGCGKGEYMLTVSMLGAIAYGQDIAEESVKIANDRLKENKFSGEAKCGCATTLLFDDNYFDCIYSADFFEHITHEQKQKVIKEAYRVLKPGGGFVIKTPNLNYLKLTTTLRRIKTVLKGRNPFNVHIPHTRNNPDNEHHGLPTFKEMEAILANNMFHIPVITYVPVIRSNLPQFLTKFFYGKKTFTEQIIMTTRKPIFYGLYEK